MSILQKAVGALRTSALSALSGSVGQVGALGDITFEVSSFSVRTFDKLSRESKMRHAKHEVINGKPRVEYLGEDVETISFSMRFLASMGVNPLEEGNRLRVLCDTGKAVPFVIGGKTVGNNLWLVESVSELYDTVDGGGRVIATSCSVSLIEYVPIMTGGVLFGD